MVQQMVMQGFVEKKEYYSGTCQFRFQIEKLDIPKWVFFGIISKHASLKSISLVHEVNVSTIKCPLPWILYIGLYGAYDQIRLQLA
ncbi:unnamed protein product [Adineta steineri]|uniref:Uncharacterized protein n=1 Tax=Adineta steineri TaxID=433720 RepID=A0A819KVL7_9BILA|nr:unnamed protein product [Adineta steineri]CAF3952425.1 unnamed protein product [Adineta steineri]